MYEQYLMFSDSSCFLLVLKSLSAQNRGVKTELLAKASRWLTWQVKKKQQQKQSKEGGKNTPNRLLKRQNTTPFDTMDSSAHNRNKQDKT